MQTMQTMLGHADHADRGMVSPRLQKMLNLGFQIEQIDNRATRHTFKPRRAKTKKSLRVALGCATAIIRNERVRAARRHERRTERSRSKTLSLKSEGARLEP